MDLHRKNYIVFFYAYFATAVFSAVIHVFLPVYFFYVLVIDEVELAFIQLLAYSVLFLKPVLSIYFDGKAPKLQLLLIASAPGMIGAFMLALWNLMLLPLFGIFLAITFGLMAIIDVAVDKIFVDAPFEDKTQNENNTIMIQLGALVGFIFPNLVYFLTFSDMRSIPTWEQFFLLNLIVALPLIPVVFLVKSTKEKPLQKPGEVEKKMVILLCIFAFLWGSSYLIEYSLEPWIVSKFGEGSFSLFTLAMIFLVLIKVVVIIIAGKISSKLNLYKGLMVTMTICGMMYILISISDFLFFIIFSIINQISAGFAVVFYVLILRDACKHRVAIYQFVAVFTIISRVLFVPLSTLFYGGGFPTEIMITIAGILYLCSVFPIFALKRRASL